jgi:hypothetical protein
MKIGYSKFAELRKEGFAEFKSLWKVEDPEWVARRKEEWRAYVGDEGGYPNLKYAGRYYVYGEEPPSYIDGDGLYDRTNIQFDFGSRLAFTPVETKEQVRRLWDIEVSKFNGDDQVHGCARVGEREAKFPNSVARVQMITEALFCIELFLYEVN